MSDYPIAVPAIKVEQPLGDFYVVSLTARQLLETCYTIRAEVLEDNDEETSFGGFLGRIVGNQRLRKPKRLDEIKRYSETVDASFPNSIILGANYDENGNLITNIKERWSIKSLGGEFYELTIPSSKKLASIIDGQHRVYGFEKSAAIDMPLLCSVYIDLPLPYHARIFTNININQKRVDKNLAYNLFQFDMELGEPETWTPETLAVYFARVLSEDKNSPLHSMLKLGLANSQTESSISMASIIDGILSLITINPKNDRELMHKKSIEEGRSRKLVEGESLSSPLRKLYINNQDKTLYDIINSYFSALKKTLWNHDVFKKTLGVHACFDFLKFVVKDYENVNKFNEEYFIELLSKSKHINFEDDFFGIQTKLRSRLRNVLFIATEIKKISEVQIKEEDKTYYDRLLNLN